MEQGALVHLNNETLLVRYCDDMCSVFIVPYESLCVLHHELTTSLPRVRKTKKARLGTLMHQRGRQRGDELLGNGSGVAQH